MIPTSGTGKATNESRSGLNPGVRPQLGSHLPDRAPRQLPATAREGRLSEREHRAPSPGQRASPLFTPSAYRHGVSLSVDTWGQFLSTASKLMIQKLLELGQGLPFYCVPMAPLILGGSWEPLLSAPLLCPGSWLHRYSLNSNYLPGCVSGT